MAAKPETFASDVPFTLDGRAITARPDETILQAAVRHGIAIPHLCYQEGYRPDGNCRACVVEIKNERALAPACCRRPVADMEVASDNERARHSQKMVLELLLADMPGSGETLGKTDSELDYWAEKLALGAPRFPRRAPVENDLSHPAIAVNLAACIQCTRCVRACREEQVNDVIGYARRGAEAAIVFDGAALLGQSSCVACGECVQACPTGALLPSSKPALTGADAQLADAAPAPLPATRPDKQINSVCPYCGVGCLLRFNVKDGRIQSVDGRKGAANAGRLCVKGRFGFDYVHHPQRLTTPLIRREGMAKTAALIEAEEIDKYFRPAGWEEALDFAAAGLKEIQDKSGARALAGFGSAKGSNEEAYLFQKLVRTGFGSNNVDHCTRLCHASSVAALLETIGSGAVSNQVADGSRAEVIMVIGARPDSNHPVAATFMKNAAKRGSRLIVIEPYRSSLSRYAAHFLQLRPSTDILLLNAFMHTIIHEDLHDKDFIAAHTEGFAALAENLESFSAEKVAPVCGIPAATIREVARLYATAETAIIFWGMGISQHTHGTDNARCLIALALLTGQIGRASTGLHPLRGQNNVQGASDMGLIPMMYPDYQAVAATDAKTKFETLWDSALDEKPGLTVVEIMHAILDENLHGMYIMGENPAMSDPNLHHARAALAKLRHLVVQDIFFTETCSFADVILPASAFPEKTGTFTNTDRRVQLARQAIAPPGEARQDLELIQEMARRLGLNWNYAGPEEVFAEIRRSNASMAGITWARLEQEDSLTYPLKNEGDPGEPVIFKGGIFPTASGRGRFVPASAGEPAELPDANYPFVFITGRQLEHWHTGTMTRRAAVLDAIEPLPSISINPEDLARLGCASGARLTLRSRRGKISAAARADAHTQEGVVMMAFSFREAAANLLTNEALDPFGKIPEFKYCAVQVEVESA